MGIGGENNHNDNDSNNIHEGLEENASDTLETLTAANEVTIPH